MEPISIRYGEGTTLPVDAGDPTAVSADMYVGKPGETYKFTVHADLEAGVGVFVIDPDDTRIPLGTYYYQINVTDSFGGVDKYPSPQGDCDGCDDDFPEFVVHEALDEQEVV